MLTFVGGIVVGLLVGLLGAGGSILTVPLLVYVFEEPDKVAVAESMAIVGLIATAGSIPYCLKRLIAWRAVIAFGLPGMAGAWLGASFARYVPGAFQLGLFAILMIVAAGFMFRPPTSEARSRRPPRLVTLVAEGIGVGALTGLVGVGGGFLIVPALVLSAGLSIQHAVGTSLAIIALKSLVGYLEHMRVLEALGLRVQWSLILSLGVFGMVGSLGGQALGGQLSTTHLRRVFALFLVVMGAYILSQNVPLLF